MKIISLVNHKGGVAKTTSAVGIALNLPGKVLLVDLDPQSNASIALGHKGVVAKKSAAVMFDSPGYPLPIININDDLDLLAGSLALESSMAVARNKINFHLILKKALANLDYDYVVVDSAPNLGVGFTNALTAGDDLVIPICDSLSVSAIPTIVSTLEETDNTSARILLLWTRFDKRNSIKNNKIASALKDDMRLIAIRIPTDESVDRLFTDPSCLTVGNSAMLHYSFLAVTLS